MSWAALTALNSELQTGECEVLRFARRDAGLDRYCLVVGHLSCHNAAKRVVPERTPSV